MFLPKTLKKTTVWAHAGEEEWKEIQTEKWKGQITVTYCAKKKKVVVIFYSYVNSTVLDKVWRFKVQKNKKNFKVKTFNIDPKLFCQMVKCIYLWFTMQPVEHHLIHCAYQSHALIALTVLSFFLFLTVPIDIIIIYLFFLKELCSTLKYYPNW